MTATLAYDEQPRHGHLLLLGAAPHDIRAALLPEDRDAFHAAYEAALTEARTSLDLTDLFKTLEHWRRLALLQSHPAEYRRLVRRAAELLTGEAIPPEEPLTVTRARVGL